MRRIVTVVVISLGWSSLLWAQAPEPIEVVFSPKGGGIKAIVGEIAKAKTSVRVQARWFDSPTIAQALVEAKKRNVDVTVVLDQTGAADKKCVAAQLQKESIAVLVDSAHKEANHRNIIIDEKTVLTGSFDLTTDAEMTQAGTLVIIRQNEKLAAKFVENFTKQKAEAKEFSAKRVSDTAKKNEPAKETKPKQAEKEGEGEDDQEAKFVGSKNSNTYHYPDCPHAKRLTDPVKYDKPPAGKTLCKVCARKHAKDLEDDGIETGAETSKSKNEGKDE